MVTIYRRTEFLWSVFLIAGSAVVSISILSLRFSTPYPLVFLGPILAVGWLFGSSRISLDRKHVRVHRGIWLLRRCIPIPVISHCSLADPHSLLLLMENSLLIRRVFRADPVRVVEVRTRRGDVTRLFTRQALSVQRAVYSSLVEATLSPPDGLFADLPPVSREPGIHSCCDRNTQKTNMESVREIPTTEITGIESDGGADFPPLRFDDSSPRRRGSHGWAELNAQRKLEIVKAIESGSATRGPSHIELNITDRCNAACYFCNQTDVRTGEQLSLPELLALTSELAANGLRSVRLSGGGEPLFHPDIDSLLDHLRDLHVVVDNITTNGISLDHAVAEKLVAGETREVIISLNASSPEDFTRMMGLNPRFFDQICSNISRLRAIRSDARHPTIIVQFLADRMNVIQLPKMYRLAHSLGVDCVALNVVSVFPGNRIPSELLLDSEDIEILLPWRDKLRHDFGFPDEAVFPSAEEFRSKDGGCFFGWYSAAITAGGAVYPCCMLLNPSQKPLGSIREECFLDLWHGPVFRRLRAEMRQALISGDSAIWDPNRFRILPARCVNCGQCDLKNMFFRGDGDFYQSLGRALDSLRDNPC